MSALAISVHDINHALPMVLPLLLKEGHPVTAASLANARPTIEWPGVFITEYTNPLRCVLFDDRRDANPFFHYLEALWIIAGRNDVATLAHILPKMADYSDDGETFHGAYGYRLRHWETNETQQHQDPGDWEVIDQIREALALLRDKPDSRQVVMSIWNPALDLGAKTKDMPCNDMLMLKVRNGKLNVTVNNRSNDVVWGCYGANVVQFSMLLAYMAAKLGIKVGTYTQVSDSFHVYEDNPYWQQFKADYADGRRDPDQIRIESPYETLGVANPFENGIDRVDAELARFWVEVEQRVATPGHINPQVFTAPIMQDAARMYNALMLTREKKYTDAMDYIENMIASDWQLAADLWVARRRAKAGGAA